MFDLQVNGLTGEDFNCDFWASPSNEEISNLCEYEFTHGVKDILATIITAPLELIKNNLGRIQSYKKQREGNQEAAHANKKSAILGVHIEGGLISRLGIHPEAHAKEFNLKNVKELIQEFPGLIKLWTLCPNLDEDGSITMFLQDQGIKVSYGHSEASYEEAQSAFEKYSVNLVTHWANAMSVLEGFKHRFPKNTSNEEKKNILNLLDLEYRPELKAGLGLAAYQNPNIYITAIAGSQRDSDLHLDPLLIKKLADHKQDKFILVSDSVADPRGAQLNSKNPPNGLSQSQTNNLFLNRGESLRGGLRTLATHKYNAVEEAKITNEQARLATAVNPYLIMGI